MPAPPPIYVMTQKIHYLNPSRSFTAYCEWRPRDNDDFVLSYFKIEDLHRFVVCEECLNHDEIQMQLLNQVEL